MTSLNEILNAAQALPESDRARLLDALWDSVSPECWLAPSDEWLAEINRRSAAYDAGDMQSASWDEVRERARRKAGLDG